MAKAPLMKRSRVRARLLNGTYEGTVIAINADGTCKIRPDKFNATWVVAVGDVVVIRKRGEL